VKASTQVRIHSDPVFGSFGISNRDPNIKAMTKQRNQIKCWGLTCQIIFNVFERFCNKYGSYRSPHFERLRFLTDLTFTDILSNITLHSFPPKLLLDFLQSGISS
jgi:hypothetical protein